MVAAAEVEEVLAANAGSLLRSKEYFVGLLGASPAGGLGVLEGAVAAAVVAAVEGEELKNLLM